MNLATLSNRDYFPPHKRRMRGQNHTIYDTVSSTIASNMQKKLREKEKGRKEEEGKLALRNFQNDIVAHVIPIEERNQAATDLSVLFRACTILNRNTLDKTHPDVATSLIGLAGLTIS